MVIPFFLLFPTDDYHTEPLIFTKRFSVGHFWSPYHTKIEGVFCIFFITTDTPISCKYSVSNSCKTAHFHAVSSFVTLYVTIPRQRLWVRKRRCENISFFYFLVVGWNLGVEIGPFGNLFVTLRQMSNNFARHSNANCNN